MTARMEMGLLRPCVRVKARHRGSEKGTCAQPNPVGGPRPAAIAEPPGAISTPPTRTGIALE
jgi:hypothetical protein